MTSPIEIEALVRQAIISAIPGNSGRRQHGQSSAIGGDIQRDVSTIWANIKALDRRVIRGDLLNILNKMQTIAGDYASS